jgi:hypothetical protein
LSELLFLVIEVVIVVRPGAGEVLDLGGADGLSDTLGDSLGEGLAGLLGGLGGNEGLLLLDELLAAGRGADVLGADADALAEGAVAVRLVDDDTNTAGSDVPDDTGAAVVVLVGHTSADSSISDDVDVLADLVGGQDGGDGGDTVTTELLGEEVAGLGLVTVRVGHFFKIFLLFLIEKESLDFCLSKKVLSI